MIIIEEKYLKCFQNWGYLMDGNTSVNSTGEFDFLVDV